MSPTIHFDTTQFNAGLKAIANVSSKTATDIVNTKAYAVAAGAANETIIASKEQLAKELGQVGTKVVRDRKTGQLKRGRRVFNLTKAEILVNWRRKQRGEAALGGAELARAARRFIGAKLGGVGFIVSGWIRAARDLAPYVKGVRFSMPAGIKVIGRKGKGEPSPKSLFGMSRARIENDALIQSGGRYQTPGRSFSPDKVAEAGLQKAMARESANMADYMAKQFGEAFRRAGAA